jgi:hypothetical protein
MELTQETLQQAKEELEAVCTKYNIILMPVIIHQGNRTISSIEIFPRPEQSQSVVEPDLS